ncbi:MAG: ribosomal RNA small subunit methyltransferase A [Acidobacteria bacterium]|nr:ribosomal RNA small subunit methyltransferase A [Acidobacteriota bacterium]
MGRGRRRRLGQSFLVNRGVVERITALLDEEPARILEIGPGRGILTAALAQRFPRVLALEVDERLLPGLDDRFPVAEVELRLADALTEPLDPLLAAEAPWQVASNLPYSVGTPILRRLWRRHDLFVRLVIMLQREVAQRIVARPGERNHGLLALERAAWARARIAFDVQPSSFRPRPRVVSSVLVVEPVRPAHEAELLERALGLAAHALTRPRKMLSNAVEPLVDLRALEKAGLDPQSRPGAVPLEGWAALAREVTLG